MTTCNVDLQYAHSRYLGRSWAQSFECADLFSSVPASCDDSHAANFED